ncbi:Loss of heterozygosity 12 chromosomal region 1 protein [Trichinella sp. T6]|nr:Loss of heterozygosity 12 chromosomal region 1 protein [Trichinella sp. T6]
MGHDNSKASSAGLPWRLRESGTDNSRSNTSRVVVVNTGQPEQLESEFLTKLKEIPIFYPLSRGNVPSAGMKSSINVPRSKLSSLPMLRAAQKVQYHLRINAELISLKQSALNSAMKDVDSMLSKLRPYPVIKFKQFARLNGDLSQIENLYMQVVSISSLLKEVVSLADRVNALLPERNRLPPLSTLIRTEEGTVDLNGPEEQTVIDISANDDAA